MNIQQRFNNIKDRLIRLSERRKVLKEQIVKLEKERQQAEDKEELFSKTTALLRRLGGEARGIIAENIDPLATQALKEVFGEDAQYKTIFRKLPKSGYSARIVCGQKDTLSSPLAADGGSVGEVLSDAVLREMVICLHHPQLNRVLMLDEPFSGVDRVRMSALGNFLRDLCADMSIQLLITTHEPYGDLDVYAENIIELPIG